VTGFSFPLDAFYARIGVSSGGAPTLKRLEQLQRAFIYSVPFENFDVQLGRGVDLSPQALVDKVLRRERGGYCFELNAVLLMALEAEGFNARSILARVHARGESTGRSHQALLVELDGERFLVDVGFGGGCPRIPMPLVYNSVSDHDGFLFRIVDSFFGYMLQCQQRGEWRDYYSFDLEPVIQQDIDIANHFMSTHPASFMFSNRVAVQAYGEWHSECD